MFSYFPSLYAHEEYLFLILMIDGMLSAHPDLGDFSETPL
jgi:hypothetical protein